MVDLSKLTEILENEGFRPANFVMGNKVAYQGCLDVSGLMVPLCLVYSCRCDNFPVVYIEKWTEREDLKKALGYRHIDDSGSICYVDSTQVWWDTPLYLSATLGVIQRVRDIMARNLSGEDIADDILRDFAAYWETGRRAYLANIPANGDQVYSIIDKRHREWIVSPPIPDWLGGTELHSIHWTACQLSKPPPIERAHWPPSNLSQLIRWFKSVGQSMQWLINALRIEKKGVPKNSSHKQCKSTTIGLLLWWHNGSIDAPYYCGVEFKLDDRLFRQLQSATRQKGVVALLGRCTYIPIERVSVERADPKYLHTRNLPDDYQLDELQKARVILVGAGTIGSFLLQQLANLGVGLEGELSIVDPDIFRPGNVGRHSLCIHQIGSYKAKACAELVKGNYPYLTVSYHAKHVQEIPDVMNCDVLINATGDQTTGVALAMMAKNVKKRPLIVHSWVVGQGLAAQVLLRRPGDNDDACYRCVCSNEYTDSAVHSARFKVAKDASKLATTFGPCHESYYPFVSHASSTAANLVVGVLTDYFRGQINYRMRTIIMRGEYCQKRPDANPVRWSDCPVCSS